MNYLAWGEPSFFCKDLYPGADFFNFFLKNSMFLLFITLLSIFAYYYFKIYQDKKLSSRVSLSIFKCLKLCGIYFIVSLFLVLISSTYTNNDVWISHTQNVCLTQGSYLIMFIVTYILASVLTYFNVRIWYIFIDKSKKFLMWINIISIILIGVSFILFCFSKGTLNILNRP